MADVSRRVVTALRSLLARHRASAALLVAVALLAKLLIPGGYMPAVEHGAIRIMLCSGTEAGVMTMPMAAAMPGMTHHDGKAGHAAKDLPCGFSGLSFTATSAADAPMLALAVVFAMLLAARRVAPVLLTRSASLRPPPRGPPLPV